jgi:hypothetical protein
LAFSGNLEGSETLNRYIDVAMFFGCQRKSNFVCLIKQYISRIHEIAEHLSSGRSPLKFWNYCNHFSVRGSNILNVESYCGSRSSRYRFCPRRFDGRVRRGTERGAGKRREQFDPSATSSIFLAWLHGSDYYASADWGLLAAPFAAIPCGR